jgi:galactose mutarotase-like enzyme
VFILTFSDRMTGMNSETVLVNVFDDKTSRAVVSRRGSLVTDFFVGDTQVLYSGRTIDTPNGPKYRGGIPILFPNAGPAVEGPDFNLQQHGFIRDVGFNLLGSSDNQAFMHRYHPGSDINYPYEFDFFSNYMLGTNNLAIDLEIMHLRSSSNSADSMPMAPGFHPYIHIPNEIKPLIKTNIPEFRAEEHDFASALIVNNLEPIKIEIPEMGIVTISSSPEFRRMIIWSEPNEDFICFEPWVGNPGAMLDLDQRLSIKPGSTKELHFSIKLEA